MERNKSQRRAAVVCVVALSVAATASARTIYVSNNGPADFATIQVAIDDANDGDVVLVAPGTYTGDGNRDIDFKGKAITVKSEAGPRTCIMTSPATEGIFWFHTGEWRNSVVDGFTIEGTYQGYGIRCEGGSPTIRNCVICRHHTGIIGWGSIYVTGCLVCGNMYDGLSCGTGDPVIANCTITGNGNPAILSVTTTPSGRPLTPASVSGITFGSKHTNLSTIENSIVWGNGDGSDCQIRRGGCQTVSGCMKMTLSYMCVQNGCPPCPSGGGPSWDLSYNQVIDADPLFAQPGHWDPGERADFPWDDVWIDGDYHLKSQAGRWDPNTGNWVKDNVTSPCIDAGDPKSPVGEEPFPNGGRINIDAYGGTAEASKSYFGEPVCETIIPGDINGDCRVDFADWAILASHWLTDAHAVAAPLPKR